MNIRVFIVLALAAQAASLPILTASTLGTVALKAIAGIGLIKLAGKFIGGHGSGYGGHGLGYGYNGYLGNGYALGGYGDYGYPHHPNVYLHQSKTKKTYVQQPPPIVVHRSRPYPVPVPAPYPVPQPVAVPVPHPVPVAVPQPIAIPAPVKSSYSHPAPIIAQPSFGKSSYKPSLKFPHGAQSPIAFSPDKVIQPSTIQAASKPRTKRSTPSEIDLKKLFEEIQAHNTNECLELVICNVMCRCDEDDFSDLRSSIENLLSYDAEDDGARFVEAAKLGKDAEGHDTCREKYSCSESWESVLSAYKQIF